MQKKRAKVNGLASKKKWLKTIKEVLESEKQV